MPSGRVYFPRIKGVDLLKIGSHILLNRGINIYIRVYPVNLIALSGCSMTMGRIKLDNPDISFFSLNPISGFRRMTA